MLQLRPDETIGIDAIAKEAGLDLGTERIVPSTTDAAAHESEYSANEQLLLDAVAEDASLFIRSDEAMAAWRIVQPVLDGWVADGTPTPYTAGTDGPPAPDGFFGPDQGGRPVPTG